MCRLIFVRSMDLGFLSAPENVMENLGIHTISHPKCVACRKLQTHYFSFHTLKSDGHLNIMISFTDLR